MSEEKVYQFNEYVLGYDKGENDRSALTISKVLNGNMYVMATLTDGSANVVSMILDNLSSQLQQKENIIKNIKAQLDYLETYSSKEDVFEDMKRRLDRIEKILGDSSNERNNKK